MSESESLKIQHGGSHYKNFAIQPVEYCQKNKLGFCEASAVKYITRHNQPATKEMGRLDLEKAIHFLQMCMEMEYGVGCQVHYDDKPGPDLRTRDTIHPDD